MDNKEKTGESCVVSVTSSQGNVNGIERQISVTSTPIRKAAADLYKEYGLWIVTLPPRFLLCPLLNSLRKWKRIFILSCVAVSLDPLFLYIPIIDDKNKCLGMDKTLRNVALAFRSLTDIAFIFHIILLIGEKMDDDPKWDDSNSDSDLPAVASWLLRKLKPVGEAIAEKMHMQWLSISIIINCLAILPIPQVTILVGFFKMGGSKPFLKQTIINVFLLFQYLLRLFQMYLSGKGLDERVGKWVKGSFYFFLYIIASHVLATFWYFFSIQREISCWHQTCQTIPGCVPNYDCGRSTSLNSTILNKLCPIHSPNTTLFDFGMYLDLLQSGNTGSINFPTKLVYSFWWGLKNLSNFGTNLETSSYVWENCFAILICAIGLLLFLYLLGNVQTYIQSETEKLVKIEDSRRTRINEKRRIIKDWMSCHGLPDDMKTKIMNKIEENRLVKFINDDVDIHFIIYISGRWYWEIMEFVYVDALKRVPMLQNMDRTELKELFKQQFPDHKKYSGFDTEKKKWICDVLTTVERDRYIAKAGDTNHAMYLIIDGVIEHKNTDETTSMITQTRRTRRCYDYYGEEVLRWAILNYKKSSSDYDPLPISPVDVKCQTKVQAFVFSSGELIKILLNVSKNISEKLEALERSPQNNTQSMTCRVGITALKKVPLLKNIHEHVLETICNHLELVSYNKNTCVVEAGKPLGFIIFVLRGKIKLTAATSSSEITEPCDDKILEEGGFYGEQLLSWASNNISFSDHPEISTHDVKCETEVEALILKAEDLRSAFSKCGSQWNFSQQLVDGDRDDVSDMGASTSTSASTNNEQTIQLHRGHDMLLEQLILIRETIFQLRDNIGRRIDDQGQRLDEMAAFLARLGYAGTSSPPPVSQPPLERDGGCVFSSHS